MALTEKLTNIADAIREKTGESGAINLGDMADKILSISGGGGDVPALSKGVKFIDYDGTVVATWEIATVASKTALPDNPEHDGLTAQGWNWSLDDIQSYIADYPDALVTVAQMYITNDGKTRIYIHLEEGRLSPYFGICPNGSVDIDWGDGSAHDTVTGTSDSTVISTQHTYASGGDYVISLTVTGSMGITGSSSYGSQLLWKNENTYYINYVYQNSIQKVAIGSGVTSIGNYAFYNCYGLTNITIPNSVTSIGDSAFYNCYDLTSVTIPNSVTSILDNTFYNCYSLTSATIPNSVTSIGNSAFYYCCRLASITIPNGVTSIGTYAFSACFGLINVTIPNSVTNILDDTFYNCYSLTIVTIPNSVTSIGNNVFSCCYRLTSVTIPNSVTSIGSYAFQNCFSLTSVTIPNGVTSIVDNTFYSCYSLTSVTIPNGVTSIGSRAFYNCYSLTSVTIPNGVTNIGSSAFYNCYSLTSVTIPNSVTSINTYAFYNCCGLGFIKFTSQTQPTVANRNVWNNLPTDCIIYVPSGTLSVYKSATNYPISSTYAYVEY